MNYVIVLDTMHLCFASVLIDLVEHQLISARLVLRARYLKTSLCKLSIIEYFRGKSCNGDFLDRQPGLKICLKNLF
jgi:hypothetical protein